MRIVIQVVAILLFASPGPLYALEPARALLSDGAEAFQVDAPKENAVITQREDAEKGKVWRVEVARPSESPWAVRVIG